MELIDSILERKLISSVFKDNSVIDKLIEKTDEEYFRDKVALSAYKWIIDRYMQSKNISVVALQRESDVNAEVLIEHGTALFEFDDTLEILSKLKARRKILQSAKEIAQLAKREGLETKEYYNQSQEIIFNQGQMADNSNDYDMQRMLDAVFKDLARVQNGEKLVSGLPTGYPSIDTKTGGLQRGHLTVVAAPTSMGKTALAINLAYNVLSNGKKVIFISLEMGVKDIGKRILSLDSRVPTNVYRRRLKEYEKKNIDASLARLMDKHFRISQERSMDTADIKAKCRKFARQMDGVDLVIVDYLQNIKERSGNHSTAKKVGLDCKDMFYMAGELNCPVILISQLNRGRNGTPKLSDLRDSGEIEETADEVWFPYRPKYDKETDNSNEPEEAKLIIAKGRTTGTGVVDMVWYPKILHWRDGYLDKTEGPLKIIGG